MNSGYINAHWVPKIFVQCGGLVSVNWPTFKLDKITAIWLIPKPCKYIILVVRSMYVDTFKRLPCLWPVIPPQIQPKFRWYLRVSIPPIMYPLHVLLEPLQVVLPIYHPWRIVIPTRDWMQIPCIVMSLLLTMNWMWQDPHWPLPPCLLPLR